LQYITEQMRIDILDLLERMDIDSQSFVHLADFFVENHGHGDCVMLICV
jgi:hypothetical protein